MLFTVCLFKPILVEAATPEEAIQRLIPYLTDSTLFVAGRTSQESLDKEDAFDEAVKDLLLVP